MIPTVGNNTVRIIGGEWRGRRVAFPDLPGLRPTPDRVRETVFNWLQPMLSGAACLDLFAGSGALGLEALSRGAKEVVFVEHAPVAARTLQEQVARLRGENRATVMHMSAARFLRQPPRLFDIVFMDPPFGEDALRQYMPLIDAGWVSDGGWIYLEDAKSSGAPHLPARWELAKSKSAGEVGYHLARSKWAKQLE